MESYTDLDLHLQSVCFFRNECYPWRKLYSVFPQFKLQQSKVANKTITLLALNNIETNKINKKQRKMNLTHMICYT